MRRLPQRMFDFYWGDGIADDVPALTYYLVLSLAPFALGLAALEALLLEDVVSALEVAGQLNRFLPEAVHPEIESLVVGTRDNSLPLLGLALVAMLWTSSGGIGVIERTLSRILDCPRHHVVTGRIRNLVLGAGVAVAVVLASLTTSLIGDLGSALNPGSGVPSAVFVAVNTLGSVLLFALIYRYAPLTRMNWRSVLLGGLPAGVFIQAVPTVVGLYVGAATTFAAARIFLTLAIILLGLYVMALVMLVGAGIAARAELRGAGPGAAGC